MSYNNEPSVRQLVHEVGKYVSPSDVRVVLDVGSRDALIALALKKFYPNSHVYAFECNPEALKLCHQNISGEDGISLIDKAVSDTNGLVDFFAINTEKTITPHADGNIGASSLFQANESYPHERYAQNKIQVEAIRLDDWAQRAGIENVDLVWMDLQGAELLALRGMGKLIENVKFIFTEVEYKEIYKEQPLFPEVDAFLTNNNFELLKKMNTSEWFGDVLYVKRNLKKQSLFKRMF